MGVRGHGLPVREGAATCFVEPEPVTGILCQINTEYPNGKKSFGLAKSIWNGSLQIDEI